MIISSDEMTQKYNFESEALSCCVATFKTLHHYTAFYTIIITFTLHFRYNFEFTKGSNLVLVNWYLQVWWSRHNCSGIDLGTWWLRWWMITCFCWEKRCIVVSIKLSGKSNYAHQYLGYLECISNHYVCLRLIFVAKSQKPLSEDLLWVLIFPN